MADSDDLTAVDTPTIIVSGPNGEKVEPEIDDDVETEELNEQVLREFADLTVNTGLQPVYTGSAFL